jgi:hypothetical protein
VHVGNRDQADLETLLRLLELSRDRGTLGVGKFDIVLRCEYGEVVFRGTQNQLLACGLQPRQLGLGAGLGGVDVAGGFIIVKRLRQVQAVANGLVVIVPR